LDYFCGGAGASDEHACIALSHVLWSIPGGAGGAPLTPSADCGGAQDCGANGSADHISSISGELTPATVGALDGQSLAVT